ncbi:MAG: AI-2E family transporter [Immundisolibacter sp.]|uniref:AI-2E family transporter n=1 Tax=Immundisolibacter sp. TaxID=1934948 RepID=UPI0019ABFF16|nr:AI-2E family transporter [Immundisolibacter sp.]MBC7160586.1 AI-2E family transporter [Immundisolibacter sp.]
MTPLLQRRLLIGAVAAGALVLLYLLGPVLAPFFGAALLAYIADPLVERLQRLLPRGWATALVFAVLSLAGLLALLFAIPALQRQLVSLLEQLPRFLDWLEQTLMPWLQAHLRLPPDVLSMASARAWLQDHWAQAGTYAAQGLGQLLTSGLGLIGILVNLVVVPVVTFYLLRDWPQLLARVDALLPHRWRPAVREFATDADRVLSGFLHGQLLVMLAQGTFYAVALSVVGLNQALLIGFAAGLVTFVPYLGGVIGLTLALIAGLVQFQDLPHLLAIGGVFAAGQMLESLLLTPLLVGDRLGMHPVAVIFAVMAGGQLFGFFGVLLALPVSAVLVVLLRRALTRYQDSAWYAQEPPC